MKFLNRPTATGTISRVLNDPDATKRIIAVAFWGADALSLLDLKDTGRPTRILCNLESGACNPKAIEPLLQWAEVRTHPRLHAKIYWTPQGMIIGSSNASSNGLAITDEDFLYWEEANVYVEDKQALRDAETWLNTVWENAKVVGQDDLKAARDLWDKRKKERPLGIPFTKNPIEAARDSDDEIWQSVKIVINTKELSKAAISTFKKQKKDDPKISSHEIYEGWNAFIKKGDWLIDVDAGQSDTEPTISYWHCDIENDDANELTYVLHDTEIDIRPKFPRLRLNAADKKKLRAQVNAILGDKDHACISIKDYIRKIDS